MCYRHEAFIPLWILPNTFGPLSAGAFWIQFGVQGAWGVVRPYSCFLSYMQWIYPGYVMVRFQFSSQNCRLLPLGRRSLV